jgi:hypothetical protein
MLRGFLDQFGMGVAWVGLYGYRYEHEQRWSWRRARRIWRRKPLRAREELSRDRIHVPICLDGDRIVLGPVTVTFEHLPAGAYDQYGLHAAATGDNLVDRIALPRGPIHLNGDDGSILLVAGVTAS